MLMSEMSLEYKKSCTAIHSRIITLRAEVKAETDPVQVVVLQERIKVLVPLWREARELAELTAHYYDRSYHKNEHYTL